MACPELVNGLGTIYDTQKTYTDSGLALGTVGVLPGRTYVWCSYTGSTALVAGEPLVVAELDLNQQNLATATATLGLGRTVITGITAGAAAIAVDTFNDGYVMVVDGGGEGTVYEIDRNLAFSAASADGTIYLKEGISVASDANTEVSIIASKFGSVQQSNQFQSESFVGIPNVAVPAGNSTPRYFWAQRNGYCPAFVTGTAVRGTAVMISDTTDGRLQSVTATQDINEVPDTVTFDTRRVVGTMVTDAISGEVQIVDLQNPLV